MGRWKEYFGALMKRAKRGRHGVGSSADKEEQS